MPSLLPLLAACATQSGPDAEVITLPPGPPTTPAPKPEPDPPPEPSVAIDVWPPATLVFPGTVAPLDVTVTRDEVAGPLEVSADGLPAGVTFLPTTIGGSVSTIRVGLIGDPDIERGRAPEEITITVGNASASASTTVQVRFPDLVAAPVPGWTSLLDLPVVAGHPLGHALGVDGQGRLVVGWSEQVPGGYDSWLFRVRPDGTLDPSFGRGGSIALPDLLVGDLAVLPDDGLALQGNELWGPQFLHRFGVDGPAVPSFSAATGPVLASLTSPTRGLSLDGTTLIHASRDHVLRFDLDGSEDVAARYVAEPAGTLVAAAPDGAGGMLVSLFDGRLRFPPAREQQGVFSFLPDDPDTIALSIVRRAGARGPQAEIFRFDDAGVIDPAFGGTGVAEVIYGAWSAFPPPMVRVGAQLLVAGSAEREDAPSIVRRLDPDGTLDETFGQTGMVDLPGRPVDMVHDPGSGDVFVLLLHEAADRVELVRLTAP